jgi:hypothetical protein
MKSFCNIITAVILLIAHTNPQAKNQTRFNSITLFLMRLKDSG